MEEKENKYILPDWLYQLLKWLGLIALPAIAWFVVEAGPEMGIADAAGVAHVLNAAGVLVGVLIGASALGGADGD